MLFVEEMLRWTWTARRKPLEAFGAPVSLPSGDGSAVVCRDGSLVTLFRLDGALHLIGREELEAFVEGASRRLNAALLERGHALHLVLERAQDTARETLDAFEARLRRQSKQLGLDLSDLLAERTRRLGPRLVGETLLLACWTRREAIAPRQRERDERVARKRVGKNPLPCDETQLPDLVWDSLPPRHAAYVSTVESLLEEAGLAAEEMPAKAAVRAIRSLLNGPESTAPDWSPHGPDDAGMAPWPPSSRPPPLLPQILVRDPERAGTAIRLGDRLYAALDMQLGPRTPRPASELIRRAADAGIPFRLSILMEGGALQTPATSIARAASAILAATSDDSRLKRDALTDLARAQAEAVAVVRLRISMLTWVPADGDPAELHSRLSRLQQIAESWGEAVFTPLVGDPLETIASSVPGFSIGGTAVPHSAPLREVLALLPIARPAPLADDRVNHLFVGDAGKPLGYSFEDDDYALDLIYGIPGRGKSVLMNSLGLAWCLQGGRATLPLTAIIDVGPSSSGLVSLIREALPPDRRHEAAWFRLEMTPAHAINPCDTPLGLRRPLPDQEAFLSSLLGLMLTPAGQGAVPEGVPEIIRPLIQRIYERREEAGPGREPHPWTKGRDPEVDEAIRRQALYLPEDALWWEVVDLLFEAGEPAAAARAQRFAVPTLIDCVAAVRDPSVQDLVRDARFGGGAELVTTAVARMLTSLQTEWPILFAPTAFDIAGARVAGIDLAAVAPQGSAEHDRQTAAMYMLARHVLTRDWWTDVSLLADVPSPWREWHTQRQREILEAPKRLCYDEFHRAASSAAARGQVERDAREARKSRVRMALVSQRIEDFGSLTDIGTGYWLLGAAAQLRETERIGELFKLSAAGTDVLQHSLTGPGPDGAPALHIAIRPAGRFEQRIVNLPGPVELWALSTAPTDVALRRRVESRLGAREARLALARTFPSGSARDRLQVLAAGDHGADTEDRHLDALAEETALQWREAPHGE